MLGVGVSRCRRSYSYFTLHCLRWGKMGRVSFVADCFNGTRAILYCHSQFWKFVLWVCFVQLPHEAGVGMSRRNSHKVGQGGAMTFLPANPGFGLWCYEVYGPPPSSVLVDEFFVSGTGSASTSRASSDPTAFLIDPSVLLYEHFQKEHVARVGGAFTFWTQREIHSWGSFRCSFCSWEPLVHFCFFCFCLAGGSDTLTRDVALMILTADRRPLLISRLLSHAWHIGQLDLDHWFVCPWRFWVQRWNPWLVTNL